MYAYKDLLELAGLTDRIYTLLSSLHNLPPRHEFKENVNGPRIALDSVQVRPPQSEELLVKPLTLDIQPGEHLMITGPVCPKTMPYEVCY